MTTWQHDETGRLVDADTRPGPNWYETRGMIHCQNGGDICLAGNHDGICCPDDSCDIDDGLRKAPNDSLSGLLAENHGDTEDERSQ